MPRGIIKFFNESKGYGFIESDQDDNIFVHHSAIRKPGYKTLEEGQEVWFDVRRGQHGLEAVNVHKI
ncbi:MAG: cold shock domain-containing protein [Candidatus Krumholzibacteria bacterium]|nr:cold shock domain-containing protein [Candidatus Krumholzibacteria bacterium]